MKISPARLRGHLATFVLTLSIFLAVFRPLGAAELTTIRLGHNGLTSEVPFYVGRDAGIFAKHGFNLEPVLITGGSTSIQALLGKSLDLLLGGATRCSTPSYMAPR